MPWWGWLLVSVLGAAVLGLVVFIIWFFIGLAKSLG
jgi:hypothetical protein